MLSNLRHPSILTVYGTLLAGTPEQPVLMMVMDYASRGSLRELLKQAADGRQQLPMHVRLRIGVSIAAGVEYLHAQKPPIIHCDLKPGNIVLSDGNGEFVTKVADFGLSISTTALREQPGALAAGTLRYQAPEIMLLPLHPDRLPPNIVPEAVDTYAFGLTLFELLHTGVGGGGTPTGDSTSSPQDTTTSSSSMAAANAAADAANEERERSVALSATERGVLSSRVNPAMAGLKRTEADFALKIRADVSADVRDMLVASMSLDPLLRPSFARVRPLLHQAWQREREADTKRKQDDSTSSG